jgi:hypothetical protein
VALDIDSDGSTVYPGRPRDQISVYYGTGEITGVFVRDHICLGHRDRDAMQAASASIQAASLLQTMETVIKANTSGQLIEDDDVPQGNTPEHGCLMVQLVAATAMSEDPFASFIFDGVLGLGLPGLSQTPFFNFFDVAAESGAWTSTTSEFQRSFSVFLGEENEKSFITFGGYRPENLHADAKTHWHHVEDHDQGYWQIAIRRIYANGKPLDYCDDGTCRGIVDTGTSLIAVPSNLGPILVDLLRVDVKKKYRCHVHSPSLDIELSNNEFLKLEPADIHRPENIEEDDDSMAANRSEELEPCVPMVMHMDLPEPLPAKTLILGEPVLVKYYTAFNMDREAPRVGFALAKHSSESGTSDNSESSSHSVEGASSSGLTSSSGASLIQRLHSIHAPTVRERAKSSR